jgi:hypothetical protein
MDMGGDEDEMPMDMDSEEGDEDEDEAEEESIAFEAEEDEVEESKTPKTAGEQMREYVEKVTAKMGDTGTNGTKSAVAGKNDMGGTASNIAQSKAEAGVEAGKGQLKGNGVLKGAPKDMNTKNVNVPGAKGATKMASQPGHGAEKKGKPEQAGNTNPIIGK